MKLEDELQTMAARVVGNELEEPISKLSEAADDLAEPLGLSGIELLALAATHRYGPSGDEVWKRLVHERVRLMLQRIATGALAQAAQDSPSDTRADGDS